MQRWTGRLPALRGSVLRLLLAALAALAITATIFVGTATAHVLPPGFDFDYCGTVLNHTYRVDHPDGSAQIEEFSRQCHSALARQREVVAVWTAPGLALTVALSASALLLQRRRTPRATSSPH